MHFVYLKLFLVSPDPSGAGQNSTYVAKLLGARFPFFGIRLFLICN